MSRSRSFKTERDMQSWWTRSLRSGYLSWDNAEPEFLAASGYLRRHGIVAMAYELKLVVGNSLALSKVEDHQWVELRKAAGLMREPFNHKISDSAVGYKPCDGVAMGLDRARDAKNGPRIASDGLLVVGYQNGARIAVMSIFEVWRRYGDKVEGHKRGGIGMSDADSVIRGGWGAWV